MIKNKPRAAVTQVRHGKMFVSTPMGPALEGPVKDDSVSAISVPAIPDNYARPHTNMNKSEVSASRVA